MSKDKKPNPNGGDLLQMPTNCCVDKCGKKVARMTFCGEHYEWFKEGLINRKGERPTDFDKKYQSYLMRTKKAA